MEALLVIGSGGRSRRVGLGRNPISSCMWYWWLHVAVALDACDMGRMVAEEGGGSGGLSAAAAKGSWRWRRRPVLGERLFLGERENREGGKRRTGESRAKGRLDPVGGKG
jgi:hypothetical protein